MHPHTGLTCVPCTSPAALLSGRALLHSLPLFPSQVDQGAQEALPHCLQPGQEEAGDQRESCTRRAGRAEVRAAPKLQLLLSIPKALPPKQGGICRCWSKLALQPLLLRFRCDPPAVQTLMHACEGTLSMCCCIGLLQGGAAAAAGRHPGAAAEHGACQGGRHAGHDL